MRLQSGLFREDPKLQSCLVRDQAHVTRGSVGAHVGRIQRALTLLTHAAIMPAELAARRYGPSTADAVLAYKRARDIVNRAYQSSPDDIVGKMTIAALDAEMVRWERESDVVVVTTRSPIRRGDEAGE